MEVHLLLHCSDLFFPFGPTTSQSLPHSPTALCIILPLSRYPQHGRSNPAMGFQASPCFAACSLMRLLFSSTTSLTRCLHRRPVSYPNPTIPTANLATHTMVNGKGALAPIGGVDSFEPATNNKPAFSVCGSAASIFLCHDCFSASRGSRSPPAPQFQA